jgi:hypothetical protein
MSGLTDAEWKEFQAIPDQGYSHRAWVDGKIAERESAARAQALDDAWRKWQAGAWADAPRYPDRVQERIANAQFVLEWLGARRDAENQEEPE